MGALMLAMVLSVADAGSVEKRPLYYVTKAITDAELTGRTLQELTLMRNWIYARAGNEFRKAWLNHYFRALPWYPGWSAPDAELDPVFEYDASKLTELDHANALKIATYESKLTLAELTAMRDVARARKDQIELLLLTVRLGGWAGDGPAPKDLTPLEDPSKLDGLLKLAMLDDFSPREVKLLRNTVFARRGRTFTTEDMKGHFSTVAWYHPDPAYTDKRLTKIDKKNIQLIKSLEDTLNSRSKEGYNALRQKEDPNWYGAA